MNRFNRFVSLNFAAFLTLSAAAAFAAPTEAAGERKDDAAKVGTLRDVPSQAAVNSDACFFAADKGKSLKSPRRPAMREPSPTLAISMTVASALGRTTPPQRAGIISPRKTATRSARTISPTSTSAAKAFAKAIRKPSIGFRNPLSKGTRGPASSSASC